MVSFSFSTAVWVGFCSYFLYTVYTFSSLLTIPPCKDKEVCLKPYLESNPKVQLYIYTTIFNSPSTEGDLTLIHHDPNYDATRPSEEEGLVIKYDLPKIVRNRNSTMFLHMFLTSDKFKPKNWLELAGSSQVPHAACSLALHHIPAATSYSLLGEKNNSESTAKYTPEAKSSIDSKPIIHLRSVIPFSIATDMRELPRKRIPSDLLNKIRLVSKTHYMPPLHIEGMSQRIEHLVPVTEITEGKANFTLKFTHTSLPKLKIWMQFEAALSSLSTLGFSPKDIDEAKSLFDTNIYLLGVTFCVALLHLTFDILAFKNDISFWKGRDNLDGLSGGVVIWRAFAQVIIFLHLFEEDTSLLVLAPAGVAVIIELWKVTKAYKVRYSSASRQLTSGQKSLESKTRELDSKAFHHLSYLLYPLCLIGAVYSLLYMPHKSWYSWLISSLVNGVYAFGFLFMLPQLFINYNLKSVAHLPWRAFMYKAFNTFIDDLFAFIITMPTSHRLACFRDDVVFLVYLYQRWLYPVDNTRVNEFGSSGESENKDTKSKKE